MRRMNQTIASLEALGNHLSGIPGRKNMVWISGGIAVLTQGAQDRWVNSYASQVRGLAQRLATQGITVYPVQATGLQVGILGTSTTAPGSSKGQEEKVHLRPMTRENDLRIWGTMDMLADVTGGPRVQEHQRADGRRARGGHGHARLVLGRAFMSPTTPTTGGASSTCASAVRACAFCTARATWRWRR